MKLALKIDVDTYRGIADGGARLVAFLRTEKIPASFFVSLGPDNSGWAATRVFRQGGFWKKMRRTSAVSLYGWRTALSGTLWPARPMGASFAARLRQWREWGFEVSPHGFDHILWHDKAAAWNERRATRELKRTAELHEFIFGAPPTSFAAPGWQAGPGSWRAMEKMNLLYHSDTRGAAPYFPKIDGQALRTPEIPTTMATWDEMLAWDGVLAQTLVEKTWTQMKDDALNVWTLHAEVEGTAYFPQFQAFIQSARQKTVQWVRMADTARALRDAPAQAPVCAIERASLPGRAGTVTCQILLPLEKGRERQIYG